jgi:hypothetical protein
MLTLTKFTDLASLLDLGKESIDDYPSLKVLVSSVYAAIESYLGRTLELDTYTEEIFSYGTLVPVKAFPVSNLISVYLDSDPNTNIAINCKIRNCHIVLPNSFEGVVQVAYTGGFEEAPDAIKRAALLQTAHEWQRKDHIGAELVSNEGGNINWPELGMLKEVKRLLSTYVHPASVI